MAGSTAGLGYGSLSDIKAPRGTRRGGGGGGQASGRAGAKLNPDEEIGIAPAKPPEQQAQHGGPRLGGMLDGISEGRPGGSIPGAAGGGAEAGGAEAAAGAGALEELAPLALLA